MRSATLLLITAARALTPLSTHQLAAEHAKNVQRHESDLHTAHFRNSGDPRHAGKGAQLLWP